MHDDPRQVSVGSAGIRELRIRLLSYDLEIYPAHSRLAPAGSPVAAEYDFESLIS